LLFSSAIAWAGLRWIGNSFDGSGLLEYEMPSGDFAASPGIARVIIADRTMGRFSPPTRPRDGVITSIGTVPILLAGITNQGPEFVDLASVMGKTINITAQGSGDSATFLAANDGIYKIAGSSIFEQAGGALGWVLRITGSGDGRKVQLVRSAVDTADGVAFVQIQGG
jgi:hypothetical protein